MLPTTLARMRMTMYSMGQPACPPPSTWPVDQVIAYHYRRYRHQEFLRFLTVIGAAAPDGPGPPPGLRQLRHAQTPCDQAVPAALAPVHRHVTPTSSTWLNMAERWFADVCSPEDPGTPRRLLPANYQLTTLAHHRHGFYSSLSKSVPQDEAGVCQ